MNDISEAPDAIPRLRRFILDLAVRGKLVEQDPDDEPAAELLIRIRKQKKGPACRVRDIDDAPMKPDSVEIPFEIPKSWEWVQSTEVANLISDKGRKVFTKDVLQNGAFPVVDQGKVFIRGYCNDKDKVIFIKKPIIVFGDHTRETKLIDFDFVVGADGVKLLEPIELYPQYYYLALLWLPLDSRGYGRHFKLLRASVIPIPPIVEQQRIVTKVDELMALCDELEAAQAKRESRRNRLVAATLAGISDSQNEINNSKFFINHLPRITARPEHIKQLRQTILNLAVRGKLVPQDPNDEPAAGLLKRIEGEKKHLVIAGKIKKQKPFTKLSADDTPFEVPYNWEWTRAGDTFDVRDGTHDTPKYVENGVPLVTSKNLRDGILNLSDVKFISEKDHEEISRRSLVEKGDILFAMIGTIGNPVIVEQEPYFSIKNVALFKYYSQSDCAPYYLKYSLQYFAINMALEATGGLQPFVSLGYLRTFPLPIPPLAEQHRIVAKVDELMALCDELEVQLTTTATTRSQLLEAALFDAIN